MKKISFIATIVLIISEIYAQNTWYCDEFPEFQPRLINRSQTEIVYYMTSESVSSLPHADSVWVIDTTHTCVMTISALEGEPIDISELKWGIYLFNLQLGDCLWQKTFFRRMDASQDVEHTASTSSKLKFLRDGQLLIESGNRIYNAQGKKVK